MTDNVFDRLMELLQSPGPVNWKLGREIATSLSGPGEPIEPDLADEYIGVTRAAALHVTAASPLDPGAVLTGINPVDRHTWATDNIESFGYLVEPMTDRMGTFGSGNPMEAMLRPLGPALLGMQVGSLVGMLSKRALGQFDTGIPALGGEGAYFIVPNVESLAADAGLDPQQVRLWAAMHEVTHHGELAVPWVRQYVADLVARFVAGLEVDMTGLMARFQGATDPGQLQELFADPGEVMGLEIGPEQQETLDDLQAVLAVLEGYADHLISSTAARLIPDLAAIRSAAIARREQPPETDETGIAGGGMLGISIDRQHADDAAGFCAEVERRLGRDRLDEIWEGPEQLPKLTELTDPVGWAARRL